MSRSPVQESAASSIQGMLLSILFWCGLGISASLNAVLMLSPRLLEQSRLAERYHRNAAVLAGLRSENAFLTQLATAIKTDADFRARLIAKELNAVPVNGIRLPVSEELAFDPRIPGAQEPLSREDGRSGARLPESLLRNHELHRHIVTRAGRESSRAVPQQDWFNLVLERCAESPEVRRRCMVAAVAVLLLSFFCCHDGFLAGSIGAVFSACGRWVMGRYEAVE